MDARLTAIELENFQSIGGLTRIEVAPLTFLCGPNSAGKSALRDALEFMNTALNGRLRPELIQASIRHGQDRLRLALELEVLDPLITHPMLQDKLLAPFDGLAGMFTAGTRMAVSIIVSGRRDFEGGIEKIALRIADAELFSFTSDARNCDLLFRSSKTTRKGVQRQWEWQAEKGVFRLSGYYHSVPEPWQKTNLRLFGKGSESETPCKVGAQTLLSTCGLAGELNVNKFHPLAEEFLGFSSTYAESLQEEFDRYVVNASQERITIRGVEFGQEPAAFSASSRLIETGKARLSNLISCLSDEDLARSLEAQFEAGSPEADPRNYRTFAEQLDRAGVLARGVERVQSIIWRINQCLKVVFVPVIQACNSVHVRSDRARIASDRPIHILPVRAAVPEYCFYDQEDFRAGAVIFSAYKGERCLLDSDLTKSSLKDAPLFLYANEYATALFVRNKGDAEEDLPKTSSGALWRRYLPSLGRYVPQAMVYELNLQTRALLERTGEVFDPLDRSCIVYPVLLDTVRDEVVRFDDVGSGFSFVLPVVAAMSFPHLRFIEQPELHLHPAAQQELCDLMIAAPRAPSLIETHSDLFFARIAQRLRETRALSADPTRSVVPMDPDLQLTPGDVRVYYFNPDPENGTRILGVELDEAGNWIDTLPDGFAVRDSVFERLVRLSSLVDPAEMARVWPWIAAKPPAMRALLEQLCYAVKLNLEEAALVCGGRIAELILHERLLQPFFAQNAGLKHDAGESKFDWLTGQSRGQGSQKPGTIRKCLALVQEAERNFKSDDDSVVKAFRQYWRTVSWRKNWNANPTLVDQLYVLARARNSAAHASDCLRGRAPQDLYSILRPIVEDGRPGPLFTVTEYPESYELPVRLV